MREFIYWIGDLKILKLIHTYFHIHIHHIHPFSLHTPYIPPTVLRVITNMIALKLPFYLLVLEENQQPKHDRNSAHNDIGDRKEFIFATQFHEGCEHDVLLIFQRGKLVL